MGTDVVGGGTDDAGADDAMVALDLGATGSATITTSMVGSFLALFASTSTASSARESCLVELLSVVTLLCSHLIGCGPCGGVLGLVTNAILKVSSV